MLSHLIASIEPPVPWSCWPKIVNKTRAATRITTIVTIMTIVSESPFIIDYCWNPLINHIASCISCRIIYYNLPAPKSQLCMLVIMFSPLCPRLAVNKAKIANAISRPMTMTRIFNGRSIVKGGLSVFY